MLILSLSWTVLSTADHIGWSSQLNVPSQSQVSSIRNSRYTVVIWAEQLQQSRAALLAELDTDCNLRVIAPVHRSIKVVVSCTDGESHQ